MRPVGPNHSAEVTRDNQSCIHFVAHTAGNVLYFVPVSGLDNDEQFEIHTTALRSGSENYLTVGYYIVLSLWILFAPMLDYLSMLCEL